MTMQLIWERESRHCRARDARLVDVPTDGESERVPILEVTGRRAWFRCRASIYTLRDGDEVVYVGLTIGPVGYRLRAACSAQEHWTRDANWQTFTVTARHAPDQWENEDLDAERRLIAAHGPRYNITGRPKKPRVPLPARPF
jgi:hypothetical protein